MGIKINDQVTWVGKIDWELRKFHGEELSTHLGTSYNSFLVRDEKTALIDTVWAPFAEEYVANLQQEVDLKAIDYIIVNHGEVDHSGELTELLRFIPDTPIYCTANAVKSLTGQYHQAWNFHVVKTGDRLNIGKRDLVFVEAPMLHWPDTMFTYLTDDAILFSNDAFGQHYASSMLYNDRVDQAELYQEALKYYANILTPFSPMVTRKIKEVLDMKLPLSCICPSHGIIWRDNPVQIVDKYLQWADNYQENQITIIYDTMWNGTKHMAEAIAQGIREADAAVVIKLFNTGRADKNDIISEIFKSKAIAVGSPTVNKALLSSVAGILEEIRGLAFKKKQAAAFGAYGWGGESVKQISAKLQDCGFEVISDGVRALWNPDTAALQQCFALGQRLATSR
jgi:flavorubredoxin